MSGLTGGVEKQVYGMPGVHWCVPEDLSASDVYSHSQQVSAADGAAGTVSGVFDESGSGSGDFHIDCGGASFTTPGSGLRGAPATFFRPSTTQLWTMPAVESSSSGFVAGLDGQSGNLANEFPGGDAVPAAGDVYVLGGWPWVIRRDFTPLAGPSVALEWVSVEMLAEGLDEYLVLGLRLYSSGKGRNDPALVYSRTLGYPGGERVYEHDRIYLDRHFGRTVGLELCGVSQSQRLVLRRFRAGTIEE